MKALFPQIFEKQVSGFSTESTTEESEMFGYGSGGKSADGGCWGVTRVALDIHSIEELMESDAKLLLVLNNYAQRLKES